MHRPLNFKGEHINYCRALINLYIASTLWFTCFHLLFCFKKCKNVFAKETISQVKKKKKNKKKAPPKQVLFCVLWGAGPHPKALSGRLISAIWWLFAVLLLACYFGNLNSTLHSNSKHVSIKTFEDLANQDVVDYGTVEAGSTVTFFKACSVAVK